MKLDDLISHVSEWLRGTGTYSNIVLSSRIRLARNLPNIPFPHWAKKEDEEIVMKKARDAVGALPQLKDSLFIQLTELESLIHFLAISSTSSWLENRLFSNNLVIYNYICNYVRTRADNNRTRWCLVQLPGSDY